MSFLLTKSSLALLFKFKCDKMTLFTFWLAASFRLKLNGELLLEARDLCLKVWLNGMADVGLYVYLAFLGPSLADEVNLGALWPNRLRERLDLDELDESLLFL